MHFTILTFCDFHSSNLQILSLSLSPKTLRARFLRFAVLRDRPRHICAVYNMRLSALRKQEDWIRHPHGSGFRKHFDWLSDLGTDGSANCYFCKSQQKAYYWQSNYFGTQQQRHPQRFRLHPSLVLRQALQLKLLSALPSSLLAARLKLPIPQRRAPLRPMLLSVPLLRPVLPLPRQ